MSDALPLADTNLVGRSYLFNNTFQYGVLRKFWPEIELNSTIFQDGKNDGIDPIPVLDNEFLAPNANLSEYKPGRGVIIRM